MAIQGLRNTGITGGTGAANDFVAGQRPLNWREGILLLYPNGRAPLLALTSQMKSSSTDDPEFNWWEKGLNAQRIELDATTGDITTAYNNPTNMILLLSSTSKAKSLPVGGLLYAEQTGEIMRIVSITDDTHVVVDRGLTGEASFAGAARTAIDPNGSGINPFLLCIGTAFKEGSDAPDGLSFDPTKMYNYTQIFRNNLEMTRTAMKTRLRTGDQVREAKREALEYHSVEMEKAFFFGGRTERVTGSVPIRTTAGILNWLTTYNSAGVVEMKGTALTLAVLESQLQQAFAYGSSQKVCFLGNRAMLLLQQCIRLGTNIHYEIKTGEKEFGMNVSKLITPFGELVLKTHPLFNQIPGGTTSVAYYGMESSMFILDMDNIKYRYLTDSDTKYEADQKTPGVDGLKSGYLTECGLEIHHPLTHRALLRLSTVSAG